MYIIQHHSLRPFCSGVLLHLLPPFFDDHLLAPFLMTIIIVHYLTPFIKTIVLWCIITFMITIFNDHSDGCWNMLIITIV